MTITITVGNESKTFDPDRISEPGYLDQFSPNNSALQTNSRSTTTTTASRASQQNLPQRMIANTKEATAILSEMIASGTRLSDSDKRELRNNCQNISTAVHLYANNQLSDKDKLAIISAKKDGCMPELSASPKIKEDIHRDTTAALIGCSVASTLIGVFGGPSVLRDQTSTQSKCLIGAFVVSSLIPVLSLTLGQNRTQEITQSIGTNTAKAVQTIKNGAITIRDGAIAVKDHVVKYRTFYKGLVAAAAVGAVCYGTVCFFSKPTNSVPVISSVPISAPAAQVLSAVAQAPATQILSTVVQEPVAQVLSAVAKAPVPPAIPAVIEAPVAKVVEAVSKPVAKVVKKAATKTVVNAAKTVAETHVALNVLKAISQ